jgi:endonuclease G
VAERGDINLIHFIIAVAIVGLSSSSYANCYKAAKNDIAYCSYKRFDVWLACRQRGAILATAELGPDSGSEDTSNRNYFLDQTASELACQQWSDSTYASHHKGYDVGHLIAIDHFDDSYVDALETNVMVNMVPQATSFNRNGAWKKTESLTECFRDEKSYGSLTIYAGVIYGNDISNDYYSVSHGLPNTPDYLWKLIFFNRINSYDLWVMSNKDESTAKTLSQSRRTIDSLIQTLEGEGESYYNPVIFELLKIRVKKPKQIELKNNSHCRQRIG